MVVGWLLNGCLMFFCFESCWMVVERLIDGCCTVVEWLLAGC